MKETELSSTNQELQSAEKEFKKVFYNLYNKMPMKILCLYQKIHWLLLLFFTVVRDGILDLQGELRADSSSGAKSVTIVIP